jgi:co-chaperonin GroES (HSP10)
MPVNVTPLHDRVLVRRLEEKKPRRAGSLSPTRLKRNLTRER